MEIHLFFKKYTDKVKIFTYDTNMLYILALDEFYLYAVFKLHSCSTCKLIYKDSDPALFNNLDQIKLSKSKLKVLIEKFSTFFRNKYIHSMLNDQIYKQSFISEQISLIKQDTAKYEQICVCHVYFELTRDLQCHEQEAKVKFASFFCIHLNQ